MCVCVRALKSSAASLQSALLQVNGDFARTHRVQIGENEAYTMAFAQPVCLSLFFLAIVPCSLLRAIDAPMCVFLHNYGKK